MAKGNSRSQAKRQWNNNYNNNNRYTPYDQSRNPRRRPPSEPRGRRFSPPPASETFPRSNRPRDRSGHVSEENPLSSRQRNEGGLFGRITFPEKTSSGEISAQNHESKPRPNNSSTVSKLRADEAPSRPQEQRVSVPTSTTRPEPDYNERFKSLKRKRDFERQVGILNGTVPDPNKRIKLSQAITLVGTCEDMCPEYERVRRIVQRDVWYQEKDRTDNSETTYNRKADESRMVKRFARSAAGQEEQLPSDLRPPHVLKQTLDHLMNDGAQAETLGRVHHFIWDRTRAIRNDFSIQQVSKPEDVRLAIECFERIARFHIVSLHQLAQKKKPYDEYDAQQEREQLDKTLLSLITYYEDNKNHVRSPNEAEFRAYQIVFQIQSPKPNLEERIQCWRKEIRDHQLVQQALKIYRVTCDFNEWQGPFRPPAAHQIAQSFWMRFWRLVESKSTTYLLGCVAEIYFPLMRRTVLHAIWKTYGPPTYAGGTGWKVEDVQKILNCENEEAMREITDKFGFDIRYFEGDDETEPGRVLDLGSVKGSFPDPHIGQRCSRIVESKRFSRNLAAVIENMTIVDAWKANMVNSRYVPGFESANPEPSADDPKKPDLTNFTRRTPRRSRDDTLFIPDPDEEPPARVSQAEEEDQNLRPSRWDVKEKPHAHVPQAEEKDQSPRPSRWDMKEKPRAHVPQAEEKDQSSRPSRWDMKEKPNESSLDFPPASQASEARNDPDSQAAEEEAATTEGEQPERQLHDAQEHAMKEAEEEAATTEGEQPGRQLREAQEHAMKEAEEEARLKEEQDRQFLEAQEAQRLAQERAAMEAPAARFAAEVQARAEEERRKAAAAEAEWLARERAIQEAEEQRRDAEMKAAQAAAQEKHSHRIQILDQLARRMLMDHDGILDQYVEHTAAPMIAQLQGQYEDEQVRAEADDFRLIKLQTRFGLKWREIAHKRRLKRAGRERRARSRRAQEERQRRKQQGFSLHREDIRLDLELFRQSQQTGRLSTASSLGSEQITSPPPQSSLNLTDGFSPSSTLQHSSPSQHSIDDHSSPQHTNTSFKRDDDMSRSGASSPQGTRRRLRPGMNYSEYIKQQIASRPSGVYNDKTKSPYIKMKAMGLNPSPDSLTPYSTSNRYVTPGASSTDGLHSTSATQPSLKRPRESDPPQLSMQANGFLGLSSSQATSHSSIGAGSMPPPPPRKTRRLSDEQKDVHSNSLGSSTGSAADNSSTKSKAQQSDEELIAACTKAREALAEDTQWYREKIKILEAEDREMSRRASVASSLSSPQLELTEDSADNISSLSQHSSAGYVDGFRDCYAMMKKKDNHRGTRPPQLELTEDLADHISSLSRHYPARYVKGFKACFDWMISKDNHRGTHSSSRYKPLYDPKPPVHAPLQYRMRESMFVPRHMYADARIERGELVLPTSSRPRTPANNRGTQTPSLHITPPEKSFEAPMAKMVPDSVDMPTSQLETQDVAPVASMMGTTNTNTQAKQQKTGCSVATASANPFDTLADEGYDNNDENPDATDSSIGYSDIEFDEEMFDEEMSDAEDEEQQAQRINGKGGTSVEDAIEL